MALRCLHNLGLLIDHFKVAKIDLRQRKRHEKHDKRSIKTSIIKLQCIIIIPNPFYWYWLWPSMALKYLDNPGLLIGHLKVVNTAS